MDAQTIFDQLSAPFPTSEVKWRVGPTNEKYKKEDEALTGQALAYVDARIVMDRLDMVVGPDNWQCNYTPGVGTSIVCNIGIKIGGEWLWKADGAGPSDMEADKGALSDAFKRAGVRWGIARYLYDLKAPKVFLSKFGKMATIPKETYPKLEKFHDDFARRLIQQPKAIA